MLRIVRSQPRTASLLSGNSVLPAVFNRRSEADSPRRATFYNKIVTADAGMDSLENANIFLPRSFSEAPICQTSAPSII